MIRDRVYRWLLYLYPAPFRRDYEDQMRYTFAELSRDYRHASGRFWMGILSDVTRSVVREHVDAWTSGMPRFALGWVLVCTVGGLASGAVMWGWSAAHISPIVPKLAWLYGGIIGVVTGCVQAVALRHVLRHPSLWVAATALALAAGFWLALMLERVVGTTANAISISLASAGLVAGLAALGALVGMLQGLLLHDRRGSLRRWIVRSTAVAPAALLAGLAYGYWLTADRLAAPAQANVFLVLPSIIGSIVGVLSVQPLTAIVSRGTTDPEGQPLPE